MSLPHFSSKPLNQALIASSVLLLLYLAVALVYFGYADSNSQHRRPSIDNDIAQLEMALEQFKSTYGCYPPDHLSDRALGQFHKKAFPRAEPRALEAFQKALLSDPQHPKQISPAEALVLYLATLSSDPRDPYYYATKIASQSRGQLLAERIDSLRAFYEFPVGRLVDEDGDGFLEYAQRAARGAPLQYFDARTYTQLSEVSDVHRLALVSQKTTYGGALPYASNYLPAKRTYVFYNPKSYQLISAGHDGQFSARRPSTSPRAFPILCPKSKGASPKIDPEELDNVANFTRRQSFKSFLSE